MISTRSSNNLSGPRRIRRNGWRFAAAVFSFSFTLPSLGRSASPDIPVFVAQVPNPNDYSLFANAGWDGNWYVGYNNGWIKKLPPIPAGHYAHAYLGAKLGRMKTLPPVGRPPEFNPIPGEIWVGLSSTPAWSASQHILLTTTDDIPLDASVEYALENTGESQWFWTEVPMSSVHLSGDNYAALWSPTPAFVMVSSAPVVAAAWGGKEINSWVAKSMKGEPPTDAKTALASGVSYFQPAIALKLVPEGPAHPIQVHITSWQNGSPDHPKPIVSVSVAGESIERVWIERSGQSRRGDVVRGQWVPVGRSLWKAPYVFSLNQGKLPAGKVTLRVGASNIWEEKAFSDPVEIEVKPSASPR